MMGADFKKRLHRVRAIQKKLSKVRVGLPIRVEFIFKQGIVTCFPREKKWVIKLNDGRSMSHTRTGRNDVTKFKARLLLKLALAGLLTKDTTNT